MSSKDEDEFKICEESHGHIILYRSDHFAIIDKPHDVHMDGDHEVTVEKIVSSLLSKDKKELKWIHQLDFATSGVLCIGLDRFAA